MIFLYVFDRCFTSLCYTADGKCVLAGGKSKCVYIYHVEQQVGNLVCVKEAHDSFQHFPALMI